jgi:hypothetical protein
MSKKRKAFRYFNPTNMPIVSEAEARANPNPDHVRMVVPEGSDAEKIWKAAVNGRVCGVCRHFRLRQGQQLFEDEGTFLEMFDKLSLNHNMDWYGGPAMLKYAGICAYWGEQHMVFTMSPSRVNRKYVFSDTTYENQDESVECPHWEEGGVGQRGQPHFIGKRRNYEE